MTRGIPTFVRLPSKQLRTLKAVRLQARFVRLLVCQGCRDMACPTEVTDEEILEAAGKLSAAGTINAYRLWDALGRRGRPDRMFTVWRQHEATLAASTNELSVEGPPVPEKAQLLADGLKGELSSGIDRAIKQTYAAVDEGVRGRYRDELAETMSTRDACSREISEALIAIGDLSEALAERDATVEHLSAVLATTRGERDLAEALSGAESEHNGDLATRIAKVETALETERQSCIDLRIAHAKTEEVIALLRIEKAAWLEERNRFRMTTERQLVDLTLVQTECRQHLSMISAQQLTIGELSGSLKPRAAPARVQTSSVDDTTTGSTGATASRASHPARRSRRAPSLLNKPHNIQDTIAVSDSMNNVMPDVGVGRAAP